MKAGHHRRRPESGESESPSELLTLGTDMGGGVLEKPEVLAAIRELRRMMQNLPPPGPDDLTVNLVFDIPGSIWRPSYEGIRTGRFSMSERILQVQVAVPDELTGGDIPDYLAHVLRGTVELTNAYVKRRKVTFSTQALEEAAADLTPKLSRLSVNRLRRLGKQYAAKLLADTEKLVRGEI